MAAHRQIDRICAVVTALTLLLTVLFMAGGALGVEVAGRTIGYENKIFDTSRVHTIDIVMDDWQSFIDTCENEEYAAASVIIDGEAYKNVGLRAKGNTSLSSVSQSGTSRYSFKLEFDQYDSTKSYHGLDKLSLNNLIQDNTLMKDYLTYRMMAEFGGAAPLCSYAFLTVNGEDWGLYLAVEALEDAFLRRNYGANHGDLYKPDSLSFGGGRGNGRDFNMDDFAQNFSQNAERSRSSVENMSASQDRGGMNFDFGSMFGGDGANAFGNMGELFGGMGGNAFGGMGGKAFGGFGMGSSDVKLQYIDDDPASYSNIFGSAKTTVTQEDQARLIASLKKLSDQEDLESVVDVDAVLRYFVVHNFVCNGDSYTGSMIHNYYVYEENGRLAMLPWDYNLAFGGLQSGNASGTVNESVVFSLGDRPMVDWIFDSETYTARYLEYYAQFLETVDVVGIISQTRELIAPYVERDPTKFCTVEAFELGVETLKTFCTLRSQSAANQLAGDNTPVDTTGLNLSAMGSMGMGGMGGGRQPAAGDRQQSGSSRPQMGGGSGSRPNRSQDGAAVTPSGVINTAAPTMPEGMQRPSGGRDSNAAPSAGSGSQENPWASGGMQLPGGMQIPSGGDWQQMMPSTQGGTQEDGSSSGGWGGNWGNMGGSRPQMGEGGGSWPQMGGSTFPGMSSGSSAPSGNSAPSISTEWILLGASVLILAAGLLFAWKFKR